MLLCGFYVCFSNSLFCKYSLFIPPGVRIPSAVQDANCSHVSVFGEDRIVKWIWKL